MTGVVLPILLIVLAQSADRVKEPQVRSPQGSQPGPSTPVPSTPGNKAFRQLFTLPAPPQTPERDPIVAVPNPAPATKIVCGMVVIQADPDVDPRFVIRAPADSTTHKIRRIPPAACAD